MHMSTLWNPAPRRPAPGGAEDVHADAGRRRALALALGAAAAALAPAALAPPAFAAAPALELVMFTRDGCAWCRRWEAEVGALYAKTPEGRAAPLRRLDVADALPDGALTGRRPVFTPTFVLLRDGVEAGRIEGYPGEAFFWALLDDLLAEAAA